MTRRLLLPVLSAAALSAAGLAAQTPDPAVTGEEGPTVTLSEAVERALRLSPAYAQSRQGVANAEAGLRSARGAFLPTLSASSGASLRSSERFDAGTDRIVSGSSDSYNAGLSLRYDLFTGGRRFADVNQNEADLTAAEARVLDQEQQVILQTETLFFDALRQADLLAVARERVGQAEEGLAMTRRQAQVGMATASDTLRARLELVNGRQAELQAEVATRSARFALGRQVGEPGPVIPRPPADLSPTPIPLADEAILEAAENASPSVRAAAAAVNASAAGVRAARTQYLPSLSFSSGYDWANQAASFNGDTSWRLALSASYPIFNGFQREAAVDRAESARTVAEMQEQDARLAARQDADAALLELRTAERAIDIAGEALAVAQEDLRVVRERYRVGVATILDVVTSQIALSQARVDLVTARYDYVLARARLEATLGREL